MKIVFIGGTGRSGTTVLAKTLAGHSKITAFDFETRFLIDPDGLLSLFNTWNNNWSPYTASKAVVRFHRMACELSSPRNLKYRILEKLFLKFGISYQRYRHVPLQSVFDSEQFMLKTNEFINRLTNGNYNGTWYGTESFTFNPKIYISRPISEDDLIKEMRTYVESLLSSVLKKENKEVWIDHTPFNILHAKELSIIFHEARFIHIRRDIRDVISSYKGKDWGAENLDLLISWMKGYYEKWDLVKAELPGESFKEIWLEELVERPEEETNGLCEFIGVESQFKNLKADLSLANQGRWINELSKTEELKIEKMLSEYFYVSR